MRLPHVALCDDSLGYMMRMCAALVNCKLAPGGVLKSTFPYQNLQDIAQYTALLIVERLLVHLMCQCQLLNMPILTFPLSISYFYKLCSLNKKWAKAEGEKYKLFSLHEIHCFSIGSCFKTPTQGCPVAYTCTETEVETQPLCACRLQVGSTLTLVCSAPWNSF